MMKQPISVSTWLNDDEFIGTQQRRKRYRDQNGIFQDEDYHVAIYGWSKNGNSFMVYTINDGHIMKLGTVKRADLLDFRTLGV